MFLLFVSQAWFCNNTSVYLCLLKHPLRRISNHELIPIKFLNIWGRKETEVIENLQELKLTHDCVEWAEWPVSSFYRVYAFSHLICLFNYLLVESDNFVFRPYQLCCYSNHVQCDKAHAVSVPGKIGKGELLHKGSPPTFAEDDKVAGIS